MEFWTLMCYHYGTMIWEEVYIKKQIIIKICEEKFIALMRSFLSHNYIDCVWVNIYAPKCHPKFRFITDPLIMA